MSVPSKILAVILFGGLVRLAFHFTWGLILDLAPGTFNQACPKPFYGPNITDTGIYADQVSLAHLTWTGIPIVDWRMCHLTNFFIQGMKPDAFHVTLSIVSSITPMVAFPFIEAARNNRSFLLGFPAILGIGYQNITGAVILPIYYILYVLTGSTHKTGQVGRRQAFSILIGLLVGHGLTSYAMFKTSAIIPTGLWQIFPVLVSLIQAATLNSLPGSRTFRTGKRIVQLIYFLSFLASAIPHFYILSQEPGLLIAIFNLYVPISTGPLETSDLSLLAKHFLQWDATFIYGSAALFTLWLASSVQQFVTILLTNIVLAPLAGPGTPFALIMMWREGS